MINEVLHLLNDTPILSADVADATGLSRATIHEYAKSKEALSKAPYENVVKIKKYFDGLDLDFSHPETIQLVVTRKYIQEPISNKD